MPHDRSRNQGQAGKLMGAYYTGPEWAVAVVLAVLVASALAFVRWAREEMRRSSMALLQDQIRQECERPYDPGALIPELAEAKNANGWPMFYPPGKHPATARLRTQLRRFEEFGWGDSEQAQYIREQIAAFEAMQSEHKHEYLRASGAA